MSYIAAILLASLLASLALGLGLDWRWYWALTPFWVVVFVGLVLLLLAAWSLTIPRGPL